MRGEIQTDRDEDKHERGMNFGLLVVANVLQRAGATVEIVDLQGVRRDAWRELLEQAIARGPTQILGIGSLSVYSFLPLVEILSCARELAPELTTIVGGQNAQNVQRSLELLGRTDLLDYLVCGDGEEAVVEVAHAVKSKQDIRIPGVSRPASGDPFVGEFTRRVPLDERNSFLDYSLYPEYRQLWPVIEESRGCPFRCDFCANVLQGGANINFKSPQLLLAELEHLYRAYPSDEILPVVLMTSIFGAKASLAHEFFELLAATKLEPRFVASTRVDLHHERYLDLGARYFDQMHFGLESGALATIERMVKTTNPVRYLERAEETLSAWHERGVHTAVNFIVGYAGESRGSVDESISWLTGHRGVIDSVWGGGLMAYPDSPFGREIERYNRDFGTSLETVSEFCEVLQTWPINPSAELSYEDVLEYVERVHDLFYDPGSYYHHYKWYVGPDSSSGTTRFIQKAEFERVFRLSTAARRQADATNATMEAQDHG
ncbi:MAG: radical SAM protein [Enhygromyxa sp.]